VRSPVHEEADKQSADHSVFGCNATTLDGWFMLYTIEHIIQKMLGKTQKVA
jgi:hypothetical protein